MQPNDWKQRWLDGQTGWHQDEVHPSLVRFFPKLGLQPGDKVFVPLCGKSRDMAWLAEQGLQVIGCEISDQAIKDFFQSQGLVPVKETEAELVRWQAGSYLIYEGDYFALQPAQLVGVKAIYDRASLIALPREGEVGRKAYLQQMRQLFGDDVATLLITLDYDQAEMDGPPFSVGYEEVIWQYAYDHVIEFLEEKAIIDEEPRFKERGLGKLTEWVFMMTRYTPMYADVSDCPQDF